MSALPRLVAVSEEEPARAAVKPYRDHFVALAVVVASSAYATLRYNLFKGVPWSEWPGYVANKVLAVAGLLLLALAAWRKLRGGAGSSSVVMSWAGTLILAHVVLTIGLFTPVHYDRLFSNGRLAAIGGWSLLTGAVALGLLELGARRAPTWSRPAGLAAMAALLGLSAIHTAAPGLKGWLDVSAWPGGLPPLTMLASVPAVIVAAAVARACRSQCGVVPRNSG